jgi:hypothetical protein
MLAPGFKAEVKIALVRVGPGQWTHAKTGDQQEAADYLVTAVHVVLP